MNLTGIKGKSAFSFYLYVKVLSDLVSLNQVKKTRSFIYVNIIFLYKVMKKFHNFILL